MFYYYDLSRISLFIALININLSAVKSVIRDLRQNQAVYHLSMTSTEGPKIVTFNKLFPVLLT